MFSYCTDILHLSEAEAYLRIAAARASREHPLLLTMLASGRLHLTAIAKLAPHLTPENRDRLLERAAHQTKRQVEELVAELAPRQDAPALIRRLPECRPLTPATLTTLDPRPGPLLGSAPAVEGELRPDAVEASRPQLDPVKAVSPATIQPLAPARYKVQFTASAELRDKLDRLRALMRSAVPDGDLAVIIDAAVTEKLERLEARRFGRTKAPRKRLSAAQTPPSSRHVPAAVRRAVHERDGGQCRYVDEQGRRCTAREALEFHHRHPFAFGGHHTPDGLALLCRTHNGLLAEIDFGREAVAKHRRSNTAAQRLAVQPQSLFSP